MNQFAKTLTDLARLCGKSKYQLAQYSGLDPSFVRRLCDGEKQASNLTIIRLTIALVMDPKLIEQHPARVPFILNALKDAQLSDAIATLKLRVSESEPPAAYRSERTGEHRAAVIEPETGANRSRFLLRYA